MIDGMCSVVLQLVLVLCAACLGPKSCMTGALRDACTSQHKCCQGPGPCNTWLLLLLDLMGVLLLLCWVMLLLLLLLHSRCCLLVQQPVEVAEVWYVTVLQGHQPATGRHENMIRAGIQWLQRRRIWHATGLHFWMVRTGF
jgi:hypothetical protein